MEFVQVPIKQYDVNEQRIYSVNGAAYKLINMDAFFFMHEERKQKQMKQLQTFTS